MLPGKIGYVRLNRFSHNTTDALRASLAQLKRQGMRGLVVVGQSRLDSNVMWIKVLVAYRASYS